MSSKLNFHDDNILARFFGKSSNFTDIPNPLFKEYNVKKGLRNEDGTGVRIGLTKVCDVIGYTRDEAGNVVPCEGDLIYRGYSIRDLLKNRQKHCGFEETIFLLLFGYLPDRTEFINFRKCLSDRYDLPQDFLTNDILRTPSRNLMNKLQSCTISLYNYAPDPDAQDTYQTLLKGIDSDIAQGDRSGGQIPFHRMLFLFCQDASLLQAVTDHPLSQT